MGQSHREPFLSIQAENDQIHHPPHYQLSTTKMTLFIVKIYMTDCAMRYYYYYFRDSVVL